MQLIRKRRRVRIVRRTQLLTPTLSLSTGDSIPR